MEAKEDRRKYNFYDPTTWELFGNKSKKVVQPHVDTSAKGVVVDAALNTHISGNTVLPPSGDDHSSEDEDASKVSSDRHSQSRSRTNTMSSQDDEEEEVIYHQPKEITNVVKLNYLEELLRKKNTAIISAAIFLLAAGSAVFLIYGVMASPTIALWLAPLGPHLLIALKLAATTVAGFALSVTALSSCSIHSTKTIIPDDDKIVEGLKNVV
jgi:hypothetical protein